MFLKKIEMPYQKVGMSNEFCEMFYEIIETIIKIESNLLKFDLLKFVRK